MITLLFGILLVAFIFKMIGFAVKLAWGTTKIICTIIVFPILLIIFAIKGLFVIAIPALVFVGAFSLVKHALA